MAHRTVFAILYTPGTKQPFRGRQLDLSVVQKLETTLLEHVVRTYSVRLGVHPIWQMRYLCENSALFFALLSSVRLLRLFCVPHAFFRHSPPHPPRLCSICVSVFFKLDWFFRGTMRLRHTRRAPCLLPSGQWQAQVQRRPCGVGAGARGGGIDPGGHVCVVQCQCAARHRRLQRSVGVRRASKHEREWKKISGRDEQHLQIDIPDLPFKIITC